jgi:hypothetical protein
MWYQQALTAGATTTGDSAGRVRRLSLNALLIKVGLALMAVFCLTDAFATQFFVSRGYVREGNAFAVQLVANGQFVWLKAVGLAACLVLLWQLYKRFPRLASATAMMASLFYVGVLLWNVTVLTRF